MVKRPSVSVRATKAAIDGDGKAIANKILLSLSRKEFEQVLSKLEFVRLKLHQVIHEAGETIKSGFSLTENPWRLASLAKKALWVYLSLWDTIAARPDS